MFGWERRFSTPRLWCSGKCQPTPAQWSNGVRIGLQLSTELRVRHRVVGAAAGKEKLHRRVRALFPTEDRCCDLSLEPQSKQRAVTI